MTNQHDQPDVPDRVFDGRLNPLEAMLHGAECEAGLKRDLAKQNYLNIHQRRKKKR